MPNYTQSNVDSATLLTIIHHALEELLKTKLLARDLYRQFVVLGLNSIRGVELAARLSSKLDRHISPLLLWQHPTPVALAASLAGNSVTFAAEAGSSSTNLPTGDQDSTEPLALVGFACRLPGTRTVEGFWDILINGKDPLSRLPAQRPDAFLWNEVPESAKLGGFIEEVEGFEPEFFGIPPRDAGQYDPQQRLLLEVSWEAIEHAGIAPTSLRGTNAAVMIGALASDYEQLSLYRRWQTLTSHSAPARQRGVVASRISYVLGLTGPCLMLDTACASSITALHFAAIALRRRETDLALIGGSTLALSPESNVVMQRLGALSPTGRSRSFDASADGYARSEAIVVLVIRRLADAIARGDRIWCVIRGTAINHNGASNGITAPNPAAQEKVLRAAWHAAGIDPSEACYVEAHGTGTPLGDPIEAQVVGKVFRGDAPGTSPLLLGSVKSNIGHTETAAGATGLIKMAMAMQRGIIPGNLHFKKANPLISFPTLNVSLVDRNTPWPETGRYAGISAFGFGGANGHAVVERLKLPSPRLFAWSGPDRAGLAARLAQEVCPGASAPSGADAASPYRLAVMVDHSDKLAPILAAWREGTIVARLWEGIPASAPRVAFLLPGLGHDWPGMARELMATEPSFYAFVERCDFFARKHGNYAVAEALTSETPIEHVGLLSTSLVVFGMAMGSFYRSRGIEPVAVIGHSIGEIGAAWLAGVYDLEEAIRLLVAYADAGLSQVGATAMLQVSLSAADLAPLIAHWGDELTIAIDEGPGVIVGGEHKALNELSQRLALADIRFRPAKTPLAPHTRQMMSLVSAFQQRLAQLRPRRSAIPLVSVLTGRVVETSTLTVDYWGKQFGHPVQLAEALRTLGTLDVDTIIQLGARPIHTGAIHACLPTLRSPAHAMMSADRNQGGIGPALATLGQLYAWGAPVKVDPRTDLAGSPSPLFLSAASPESLQRLALAWSRRLSDAPEDLASLCFSAATTRNAERFRLVTVVCDRGEAAENLAGWAAGREDVPVKMAGPVDGAPRVAFLFSGQGPDWEGVGRTLYAQNETFRAELELCDAAIYPLTGWHLVEALDSGQGCLAKNTAWVQPCIFAVQVAMARLWLSWGLHPSAVIGQSLGEVAAAHIAGVLSLEDSARVVVARAREMADPACLGQTLEVSATPEVLGPWLEAFPALALSGRTGPETCLVAGEREAAEQVTRSLEQAGITCRPLKVTVALHSPLVEAASRRLAVSLVGLKPVPAVIPLFSTLTGGRIDGVDSNADFWRRNVREPVSLLSALDALVAEGIGCVVEIGPHPVLQEAVRSAFRRAGQSPLVVASLRRGKEDLSSLMEAVGGLFLGGISLRWREIWPDASRVHDLPTYVWKRRPYWLTGEVGLQTGLTSQCSLLGSPLQVASNPEISVFQSLVSIDQPGWLNDHQVNGRKIVPASAWVEMAMAAADATHGEVRNLELLQTMVPAKESCTLQISLKAELGPENKDAVAPNPGTGRESGRAESSYTDAANPPALIDHPASSSRPAAFRFEIASRSASDANAPWTMHARGRVIRISSPTMLSVRSDHLLAKSEGAELKLGTRPFDCAEAALRSTEPTSIDGPESDIAEVYQRLEARGLEYKGAFRAMRRLVEGNRVAEARLESPSDAEQIRIIHPVTLDAAFQVLAALDDEAGTRIPVRIQRIRVNGPVQDALRVVARRGDDDRGTLHGWDSTGKECLAVEGFEVREMQAPVGPRPAHWLHLHTWQPLDIGGRRTANETWLVLGGRPGQREALAIELESQGGKILRRTPAFTREALSACFADIADAVQVVYLSTPGPLGSLEDLQVAITIGQSLLTHPGQLWLITTGGQAVDENPVRNPNDALLWGFGRSMSEEMPENWAGLIDLDPDAAPEDALQQAVTSLLTDEHEDQVLWRGGQRYAFRLERMDLPPRQAVPIRRDGSYLITGGLGGLGGVVARWLVARGARRLILLSRDGIPSRPDWDSIDPTSLVGQRIALVRELEAEGATVFAPRADVSDSEALTRLVSQWEADHPPICGVIHAAGVLRDQSLDGLAREDILTVASPKVGGALALAAALDGFRRLDFLLIYSSAAGFIGSSGQASYAAANAFLDAWVTTLRKAGVPATSLAWGAWSEVGMARKLTQRFASRGVGSISPEAGLEIQERLMGSPHAVVGVLPMDWPKVVEMSHRPAPRWMEKLLTGEVREGGAATPAESPFGATLEELPVDERLKATEEWLVKVCGRVLNMPAERLSITAPLTTIGMDSLVAVELQQTIERNVRVRIPISTFLGEADLKAVAQHVLTNFNMRASGSSANLAKTWSPLVVQRREAAGTPLFWVHPVGGSAFCYQPLARRLEGHPIYAFQCPLDGEAPQCRTILELAERYRGAMSEIEGPLWLAGWSLGGLVCWELARLLTRSGHKVNGLLMIDSIIPTRILPTDDETLNWFLRDLNGGDFLTPESGDSMEARLEAMATRGRLPRGIGIERARLLFEVFRTNLGTMYDWCPEPGSTPTLILAAREQQTGRRDALEAMWRPFARGGLNVVEIPGNHYTLLETRYQDALLAMIRQWLSG